MCEHLDAAVGCRCERAKLWIISGPDFPDAIRKLICEKVFKPTQKQATFTPQWRNYSIKKFRRYIWLFSSPNHFTFILLDNVYSNHHERKYFEKPFTVLNFPKLTEQNWPCTFQAFIHSSTDVVVIKLTWNTLHLLFFFTSSSNHSASIGYLHH